MSSTDQNKKNIKIGIVISYISLAVSVIGSFVVTRKVLDYIGDYQYGLYSFVLSIVNWATIVSNSLSASYVRFATIEANKNNGDVGKINTIYLKMLAIIAFSVLVVGVAIFGGLYAAKISLFTYNWEDSKTLYVLFAISLVNISLTIFTSLYGLFVTYKKRFIFSRALALVISVFGFAAHWVLAYFTKSVAAIAIYTIAATLLSAIGNAIFARKNLGYHYDKAKLKDNGPLLRQIALFSGIILFNSVVDQINNSADQIILGAMGAAETVTIYKMGQSLSTYILVMSTSISSSFIPSINELVVKNDDEAINALYLKISKLQATVLCTVTFGFLICGHDFMYVWLGDNRVEAYYVGVVLMLLSLCPLTINASIEIQRARNKHLFRALAYFFVALGNIGLSILFVYIFPKDKAMYSCLLGTVISTILSHWIAMNIYNAKKMKLPVLKQMGTLGLFSIIGLICCGIVYLLFLVPTLSSIESHLYRFLIKGSLFVALYSPLMVCLNWKTIKPKLALLKNKLKGSRQNEN